MPAHISTLSWLTSAVSHALKFPCLSCMLEFTHVLPPHSSFIPKAEMFKLDPPFWTSRVTFRNLYHGVVETLQLTFSTFEVKKTTFFFYFRPPKTKKSQAYFWLQAERSFLLDLDLMRFLDRIWVSHLQGKLLPTVLSLQTQQYISFSFFFIACDNFSQFQPDKQNE